MIWSQACTRWLQTYSYQRNSKHGQHPSALRKSATHGPVHNRPMSVFWNSKKQIQLFSDSTRVGTVQDKLRHADPKTHPDTQRHGWMICPQIHARMWMHARMKMHTHACRLHISYFDTQTCRLQSKIASPHHCSRVHRAIDACDASDELQVEDTAKSNPALISTPNTHITRTHHHAPLSPCSFETQMHATWQQMRQQRCKAGPRGKCLRFLTCKSRLGFAYSPFLRTRFFGEYSFEILSHPTRKKHRRMNEISRKFASSVKKGVGGEGTSQTRRKWGG